MYAMIDLLSGADAIPWDQHERPDGDPDDLDIEDVEDEDWEAIDAIPAPGPVHYGLPTTDSTSELPF